MKVLLIDVNCKYSSTGKIVYDLYTSINRSGHSAAICYGRGPVIREDGIYKFGLDWETKIHALLTRITGLTGCFSPFSTHRALRFIKQFNPDVVHIHELHAYFVNLKPLLRYLAKMSVPIVWTFHCEFMYTGKCGHAYDCFRYIDSCSQCPQLHEYPKTLLFDWTRYMRKQKEMMLAELKKLTIITPSEWLASRVRTSFLKEREIKVIHNGINTDTFYPRDCTLLRNDLGLKSGTKVVLSVAPDIMSERKGGKWVLKLAEAFEKQDVHFVLVGVCDLQMPHGENTTLVPLIKNQNDLATYYSLADVFVICSSRENFPTTCLEALCCGTPICGFNTGGTRETAPEPYGKFSEYGDIEALKLNLLEVLDTAKLGFGKEVVKFGNESYSRSAMYSSYQKIYFTAYNQH